MVKLSKQQVILLHFKAMPIQTVCHLTKNGTSWFLTIDTELSALIKRLSL